MVNYVTGNLFDAKTGIIAHGVNCKGAYGSGVAGQIAKLYPKARKFYFDKHNKEGWELGDVQLVSVSGLNYGEEFLMIANCATQYGFGGVGLHANYEAIKKCMDKLDYLSIEYNQIIHMPRIGAGLANGDWEKIKTIIERSNTDGRFIVYSL